jgi:HD-GYP domain-containing protein (c-di-GMP phosphodiesterase class II)
MRVGMIISKDILDSTGIHILLTRGTVLDLSYIDKLNHLGVDTIEIVDETDQIPGNPSGSAFPQTDYAKLEDKILEMFKKGDVLGAITFANTVLEKLFGKSENPFMITNMSRYRYIPQSEYTLTNMKPNSELFNNGAMADFLATIPEDLKKLEFMTTRFNPPMRAQNVPADAGGDSLAETLSAIKNISGSEIAMEGDMIDDLVKQINLLRNACYANDGNDQANPSPIENSITNIFQQINKLREQKYSGILTEEEMAVTAKISDAVLTGLEQVARRYPHSLKTLSVLHARNVIETTSKVFAQLQLLMSSQDMADRPAQNFIRECLHDLVRDVDKVASNLATHADESSDIQASHITQNIKQKTNALFPLFSDNQPVLPAGLTGSDSGEQLPTDEAKSAGKPLGAQKPLPLHVHRIDGMGKEQLDNNVAYKERFNYNDLLSQGTLEKFISSWKKTQSTQVATMIWDNYSEKKPGDPKNYDWLSQMIYKILLDLSPVTHERVFYSKITHNFILNIIKVLISNPVIKKKLNDMKDYSEDLFYHSISVTILSLMTGITLGYPLEILKELGTGALLHDYGKIFISKVIYTKPAKLDEQEMCQMQQHTINGYEELRKTRGISARSASVALQHHERTNGSGYPNGLKPESIEQFAQIVGISDVYDAMTTDKPYRKGFYSYESIEFIRDFSGFLFDFELTQNFLFCLEPYPVGGLVQLNSGEIGIVVQLSKYLPARPILRFLVNREGKLTETFDHCDLKKHLSLFITKVYN